MPVRTLCLPWFAIFLLLLTPAVDAVPTLLVSSRDTDSVLEYDAQTGEFLRTVVTTGDGGLDMPTGLILAPDGSLLVGNGVGDNILRFDFDSGGLLGVFTPNLNGPVDFTYGPNGNLFVCLGAGDTVCEIDPITGARIGDFVDPGAGGLVAPWGMTFTPRGTLLVSDHMLDDVLEYDADTGAFLDTLVPAGSGGLEFPTGILYVPGPATVFILLPALLLVRRSGRSACGRTRPNDSRKPRAACTC